MVKFQLSCGLSFLIKKKTNTQVITFQSMTISNESVTESEILRTSQESKQMEEVEAKQECFYKQGKQSCLFPY